MLNVNCFCFHSKVYCLLIIVFVLLLIYCAFFVSDWSTVGVCLALGRHFFHKLNYFNSVSHFNPCFISSINLFTVILKTEISLYTRNVILNSKCSVEVTQWLPYFTCSANNYSKSLIIVEKDRQIPAKIQFNCFFCNTAIWESKRFTTSQPHFNLRQDAPILTFEPPLHRWLH